MTTFDRIKPWVREADGIGRVLLSQVEFSVTIHRQQAPFGSTVADFDCSEWDYRIKSLCGSLPVIECEPEDWLPVETVVLWEHPTGLRFRLTFRMHGLVGRSHMAYGVEVEREFP